MLGLYEQYTPNLSLEDIFLLDKVQKRKIMTDDEARYLKAQKYIEGRKPNYLIAAQVFQPVPDKKLKAQYIRQKGFDDAHYKKMMLEYLEKYNSATRQDFDSLLLEKLPEILSEKQKRAKVGNLISSLRIDKQVKNTGSTTKPVWVITK